LRNIFPWRKGNLLRGCKNINELDKIIGKNQDQEEDAMYYVNYDRANNLVWCGTTKGWTQHLVHAKLYQSAGRASQGMTRVLNQERWANLCKRDDVDQIPYEEAEELLATLFAERQPKPKEEAVTEQPKAEASPAAPAAPVKTAEVAAKATKDEDLINRLLRTKKDVQDAREMLVLAQSEFDQTLAELHRSMGNETAQALST